MGASAVAPMSKSLDAGVYGLESPSAEKREEKRKGKYVNIKLVKQWTIEHYNVLRLFI